ncbi:MAG: Na/Pi cotransporter family protein [Tissierellia bacterium]|nr:Na/Pi cotransporter family protein [Tissierellia bacterium]
MKIIIPVIGGLALFLYGMNLMGNGLQKVAGSRLKSIVGALTKNKYIGVLVGVVVTMVIQSSSATTVMVIGFVNAGIMNLSQAVGVIIGANLGTTVTGQIIAFNINSLIPIAIAVGVLLGFISKKDNIKDAGEIFIGFGLLFLGMQTMSDGLNPLTEMPWFTDAILKLNNPIIGIPVGIGLTTAVQSSSASIGLLEALGKQGLIGISQAFPVLFGDNIGTTTTALISTVGASKNAKRAGIIHLLFNVVGTIIFMFILRKPVEYLVVRISPGNVARQIANAHTIFNLINVAIQLPFSGYLVKAAYFLVPGDDKDEQKVAQYLDNRILETPSIAIIQAKKEVVHMGSIVLDNLNTVKNAILMSDAKNVKILKEIYDREKNINQLEQEIIEYLVQLSNKNLSEEQNTQVFIMQDAINDLERMGDHIVNVTNLLEIIQKDELDFSDLANEEFENMINMTREIVEKAMYAFENDDDKVALEALEIEDKIDEAEKVYRHNHIRRINKGICVPSIGVNFLDMISNLERISDHCVNISNYVLKREI